jgi:tetratricopeptide (TPR) repeat protein
MMAGIARPVLIVAFILSPFAASQESHVHSTERLGKATFPISCRSEVEAEFNRGIALLHSFAYADALKAFREVAEQDPKCAMAHWGMAMTYYHQLWEPPIAPGSGPEARKEIDVAQRLGAGTERERKFIEAAGIVFADIDSVPYQVRIANYVRAMSDVVAKNRKDVESQVFYALALLASASPADKMHSKQKEAVSLLEPLFYAYPDHPGIAHYLIHACDNSEMAERALPEAKSYSKIAPAAPHAMHMPSHIFTRLGNWDDSISSNLAAKDAASRAADTGEQLHTMDYLVYAYLQSGRESSATMVLQELKSMPNLNIADFKIGYAATAMPIRCAVERQRWSDAAAIVPPVGAPLHVVAIAVWAQGLGLARGGQAAETQKPLDDLQQIEDRLSASGNEYWTTQVRVMKREVMAWSAEAQDRRDEALALMRKAADEEDSVEKLPVTPGPIVPAREQLGELLLEQGRPDQAAKEFQTALANAPGRRGALRGASEAAQLLQQK